MHHFEWNCMSSIAVISGLFLSNFSSSFSAAFAAASIFCLSSSVHDIFHLRVWVIFAGIASVLAVYDFEFTEVGALFPEDWPILCEELDVPIVTKVFGMVVLGGIDSSFG